MERSQRRATKFILNNFSSDYRDRLITLNLLPLLYLYELLDLRSFIKCLKFPDPSLPGLTSSPTLTRQLLVPTILFVLVVSAVVFLFEYKLHFITNITV